VKGESVRSKRAESDEVLKLARGLLEAETEVTKKREKMHREWSR